MAAAFRELTDRKEAATKQTQKTHLAQRQRRTGKAGVCSGEVLRITPDPWRTEALSSSAQIAGFRDEFSWDKPARVAAGPPRDAVMVGAPVHSQRFA